MGEAPDAREQEDCPSASACRGSCDQHPFPRAGETWRWAWLSATITKAGPKRVTYWTGTESISTPTDRFLARFHLTGLTRADADR